MRNNNRIAVLAAVCVLGLTATGCSSGGSGGSSGGSSQAESAHEITLIMSNHPWQKAIQPHLPEFTKQTGIQVKVQTFAEQQMRDKVQLTLQSRSSAMDVFMTLPSREGPQFAASGYYEGVDSYFGKAPSDYKADDFTAGAMSAMKIGGKTIGVPINVEGTALYYRKDVFNKLGLQPPKTLDELEQVSQSIKTKGSITPVALRGASAALPFTFAPFLHSVGGTWTTGDGKTPAVQTPEAVEAIRRYSTLAKDYGPPGVINNTFTQSSALMAQGQVAMEIESTNELSSITGSEGSKVTNDLGVTTFPAGTAGSKPTVLSWALAMSPFGKNKADAWTFIQWATSPATELSLTKDGIAPPRTSVLADPAYTATLDTPLKKEWYAVVKQVQEKGDPEVGPVGVKAPAMRQVVGDAVGKAILGQATPEQAAAQMQQGLTPLLAGNGG